ncbi:hypothetical protein R69919_04089 [Paraburkholderia gardini]|nr:hypothetical protein R69919_04089 [Paraburkholderia gardini]
MAACANRAKAWGSAVCGFTSSVAAQAARTGGMRKGLSWCEKHACGTKAVRKPHEERRSGVIPELFFHGAAA